MNLAGKVTLEKEGEIILMDRAFRLRGKGANDRGEMLYFADIRDIEVADDSIILSLFGKDRFILSHIGGVFDQLVKDLFSIRNNFLIDSLFLKQGKLVAEFDAYYECGHTSGRTLGTGRCTVRLYEESVVVIPQQADAFSLSFHFMQTSDFDDDEYQFKVITEHGLIVVLSQFGNGYDEFQELFYREMSRMYQEVIHELEYLFIDVAQEKIVKLAHLMRRGKAARMKDISKIDKDLGEKVLASIFKDEMFAKTIAPVQSRADDEHTFIGLSVSDGKKEVYRFMVLFAIPSVNLVSCTLGSYEKDIRKVQDTYFFRIIMEKGVPEDHMSEKVLEINQACLLLNFVPDPLYKDTRELRNSIYNFAIRKLSYLRMLRGSFLARCPSILPDLFSRNFERVLEKARLDRLDVAQPVLTSVE